MNIDANRRNRSLGFCLGAWGTFITMGQSSCPSALKGCATDERVLQLAFSGESIV